MAAAGLLVVLGCWPAQASVPAKGTEPTARAKPTETRLPGRPALTVRIPQLRGDVVKVYSRLHALGLRVSIPHGLSFDSTAPPRVKWTVPRAGRRVKRGSVVTLYLFSPPARVPGTRGRLRGELVPRLVGGDVSGAYRWASRKRLIFRAYLAPLTAGNAPGLFANYRVTRQRPAPGTRLVLHRQATARKVRRQPPLTVWGALRPPVATTAPASAITRTTAALVGAVNPNGEATTYYFNYGPTAAYGSATPARRAGWGNRRITVAAALSGLNPATTYHYRLVASSRAGATYGADTTFTTAGYYQNPVYGAAEAADPFVLDNGGRHSDYWAYATGYQFPVLHSSDLVHWTAQGRAMSTRPSWVVGSGDWHPWAPSLLTSDSSCPGTTSSGCYVMYYVGLSAELGVNCIGVATSPTPGGPFLDQGPLDIAGATPGSMPLGCGDATGQGNIDPSPFIDPSGQPYLYVSTNTACGGGSCTWRPTISVIPLTADFLHAAGSRVSLFSGDAGTWEAAGVQTPTVEGPAMVLHGGTYYLFYSGGNWQGAYGMGYATSNSPTGPFTKSPVNPILRQTSAVIGPGGGDRLVTGPHGGIWLSYAARAAAAPSPRTLRIDPLTWTPAGTPGAPDTPVVDGPTATPQLTQP